MLGPSAPVPARKVKEGHRQAVERAITAMHQNLGHEFTLEDMAGAAYLSPFHFNRVFRRVVGTPPGHYLSALRLQKAKRLLMSSDANVTEICFEVGFKSLGTFSRRFKDFVGLSPTDLRASASCPSQRVGRPVTGSGQKAGTLYPVSGRVLAPKGFHGLIFVGLFESPIPQGRPCDCQALGEAGGFSLYALQGCYYLLAAAVERSGDSTKALLDEAVFRAGSPDRPLVVCQGRPEEPQELELRPPTITDPPILPVLPWLLEQERQKRREEAFSPLPDGKRRASN